MSSRIMRVGIAFVMALAVPLAGCAGKIRLSSKAMCESHGGTYSAQAKQCTYPPNQPAQGAEQMCRNLGGVFDPIGDGCDLAEERTK